MARTKIVILILAILSASGTGLLALSIPSGRDPVQSSSDPAAQPRPRPLRVDANQSQTFSAPTWVLNPDTIRPEFIAEVEKHIGSPRTASDARTALQRLTKMPPYPRMTAPEADWLLAKASDLESRSRAE